MASCLADGVMIDFKRIAHAALPYAHDLCARWLPDGHVRGHEWYARNPRRSDKRAGSFHINLHTGAWADFAADAAGRDLISLAAYLFHDGDQGAAARSLARALRIDAESPTPAHHRRR